MPPLIAPPTAPIHSEFKKLLVLQSFGLWVAS